MHWLDTTINDLARRNGRIVTRSQIHSAGGNDDFIRRRLERGQYEVLHPGVYLVGVDEGLTSEALLRAATRAAGEGAAASHRSAFLLHGLEGIGAAPVELVVPYTHAPLPSGTIVHRSRRIEPVTFVRGIPVTPVERTLLEVGSCVPRIVVAKGYASAVRKGLTTQAKVAAYLEQHGGRGRRGTRTLRGVVGMFHEQLRVPGSAGCVELALLLERLAAHGIEPPVFEYLIDLPDGTKAAIDVAWPRRWKGIEVDGLDAHSTGEALDSDLDRANMIDEVGFRLRRFSVPRFRREPERVLRSILRFLESGHIL